MTAGSLIWYIPRVGIVMMIKTKGKVIAVFVLCEISSFGAENIMKNALKNIDWFWILKVLFPWIIFGAVTAFVVIVLRTVVEKLIDKLTAKKRLKRDIEESMYWKEVDRIADEELHYRRTAMRYREIEEKKTEKNKVGRK